jgi:hypothetical protein
VRQRAETGAAAVRVFKQRSFSLLVMKLSRRLTVYTRAGVAVFSFLLNAQEKQEGPASHDFGR